MGTDRKMTRLENRLRFWMDWIGKGILMQSSPREARNCRSGSPIGHWLCGLAMGVKPCCIQWFIAGHRVSESGYFDDCDAATEDVRADLGSVPSLDGNPWTGEPLELWYEYMAARG